MKKCKILSTKKLDAVLVSEAKAKGIEMVEQEAISIQPVVAAETGNRLFTYIEDKKEVAVFTSANAVNALKHHLKVGSNHYIIPLQVFCLSGKTKEAVLSCSYIRATVMGEGNNAAELAQKIIGSRTSEVLFFCGDKRRDELPDVLRQAGITVQEMIVYETVATPVASTDSFDAVLFFSPSAVNSFFSVNKLQKHTACFAIGKTTAAAISSYSENKIIISDQPSQEALMEAVYFYFHRKG